MRILIIDDMQIRHDVLEKEYRNDSIAIIDHAFNVEQAKKFIGDLYYQGGIEYDLISFDHDLCDFDESGKEYTGVTVARWMAENMITCGEVRVHSANPVGAQNILSIVKSGSIAESLYHKLACDN